MLIDRNNNKIVTSIYRKPTFTGVYTHFHSFLPSVYKIGLLSTLLFRYFSICSNYQLFHLEVVKFKKIFLRNGYSPTFIENSIYRFLNKIFSKKVIKITVPKRSYEIILPYLGPLSNKIHRRLKSIFQTALAAGQIKVVFKTTSRLSHMFRFKDMVSPDLKSHVIYEFKCSTCNSGYIGEKRVHFKTRSCQHLGISPFTEKPLRSCVNTAITGHI